MSPSAIVEAAKQAGMDVIALTDHQSAKNTPAIAECARRAGLHCLYGAEVCTAEEVHTVALFDDLNKAAELTEWIGAALPRRKNDPDVFGDQPVVSWDDEILEMEEKLLAAPCARTIAEVSEFVHEREGLYIAAHADRPNFSIIGSLGMIPESPDGERYFDAIELSRTAEECVWASKLAGYALVRSSDAHHLGDVAKVWTEFEADEFSFAALKGALVKGSTKLSPRLHFGQNVL